MLNQGMNSVGCCPGEGNCGDGECLMGKSLMQHRKLIWKRGEAGR